jgi:hypothetical protein
VVDSLGSIPEQRQHSEQTALNAPLFRSLVERLESSGQRWVVLDLGAAQTELITLFGRFRCRLDIADLAEGLDELNGESDPRRLLELAEEVLPGRREGSTDLVLCWDLVNYLRRPALTALMERVRARMRPGSLVHALVVYSAADMPARPCRYVPAEGHRLLSVGATPPPRGSPPT